MKKKLITTIFSALLALALFCAAQAAVDRAGAQALALKAAGVAEADVRRLSVETETRGGRTVYDVEFRFGGYEYEYWISAEDGAIVKDSWELDPEKTLEMAREQGSGAIDEARALSAAPDDFEVAAAAIDEMVRQVGAYQIGEDGLMKSGVILRHLVLPGQMENTKRVIDYVSSHFPPKTVLFSLMSQYTPQSGATGALARRLNEREYRTAVQYMRDCGLTDGFCQELSSAKEEYTPVFDLQGV